jgi:hypothetical protein
MVPVPKVFGAGFAITGAEGGTHCPLAHRSATKTAQCVGNAALPPDFHPAPSARIVIELGELDPPCFEGNAENNR